MNQYKLFFPFFALILFSIAGCKKEDKTFGPLDTPAKPEIEITLVGQDTEHPNGDGSGNIILKVVSEKAISYKVDFGDSKPAKINTSNVFNYAYSLPTGNNELTVTVSALGKGEALVQIHRK